MTDNPEADTFPRAQAAFIALCDSCGWPIDHVRFLLGTDQRVPRLPFNGPPSWLELFSGGWDNCELWHQFAAVSEEHVFGPIAWEMADETVECLIPLVGLFHPWQLNTPDPIVQTVGVGEEATTVELSWAHVFVLSFFSETMETPELPTFHNGVWVRADSEECGEFYAALAEEKYPAHALLAMGKPVWRGRRINIRN